VFLYYDYTRDLKELERESRATGIQWHNNFTVSQMSTQEFFRKCEDKDRKEYVYFSGRMSWVAAQYGPAERLASRATSTIKIPRVLKERMAPSYPANCSNMIISDCVNR
jgi:hypothetical protein